VCQPHESQEQPLVTAAFVLFLRFNPDSRNFANDTHDTTFSLIKIDILFFYHYYLVCEATPGLLCQLRAIVKMIVEKQMECRLEGETEVLRENLPQRHFCPSQNQT
jgi:hypothetical protein